MQDLKLVWRGGRQRSVKGASWDDEIVRISVFLSGRDLWV